MSKSLLQTSIERCCHRSVMIHTRTDLCVIHSDDDWTFFAIVPRSEILLTARRLGTGRRLGRPDPLGRKAGRPAGNAIDQVRTGDRPQDRKGARAGNPDTVACRRGNRVKRRALIRLLGGVAGWPLAAEAQERAVNAPWSDRDGYGDVSCCVLHSSADKRKAALPVTNL